MPTEYRPYILGGNSRERCARTLRVGFVLFLLLMGGPPVAWSLSDEPLVASAESVPPAAVEGASEVRPSENVAIDEADESSKNGSDELGGAASSDELSERLPAATDVTDESTMDADDAVDASVDDPDDPGELVDARSKKERRRDAMRAEAAGKAAEAAARPELSDEEIAAHWPRRVHTFDEHSPYYTLGEYDWELTRRILQADQAIPEHTPKGKVICEIHYRPQDIFLPDEPFPLFFNKFHSTTRVSTVASAAPVEIGDEYSELLREDVRLEIQDPNNYSTVVVVPTTSAKNGCVELYVVTRDLWSLKAGVEPKLSGGVIEFLGVSLQETNFLGLNDTIGVDFVLEQGSWEIGPVWQADWFMNRNLYVSEQFRVIFDRERGGYEGTANTFKLARPLRSSWDRDAWYVQGHHRSARGRVYDGAAINQVSYVDPDSSETYLVDERWNDLRMEFEGGYTRSYGLKYKTLVTSGLFMDLRNAEPAPMDASIPESVLELFDEDRLPRSERAIGLHFRVEFYRNSYFHLTNYNSFAVSESYRRGLTLVSQLRYSEPIVGADVRFLEGEFGASYVAPLGEDALFSIGGLMGARLADEGLVDRRLELSTRLALPTGLAGRFVVRAWARYLGGDSANERFRVGATTSLRGYEGYAAEGYNAWLSNIEWRSNPVELLSLFFGAAAFLDVGSAWESGQYERTYASVGLGLRFFIPQAMSRPGSLDVAFPVGHGAWSTGMPSPVISLRFGHAFEPVERLNFEELWR